MRAAIRQVLFSQPPYSPGQLFANGEQGAWFDPSDFGSMFQDSAGSTPVTAIEQPVGLILDKSGRGNHASQSTTTNRPILRQDANNNLYLDFDGTDDGLVTTNINFSSTDKMSVFFGMYWASASNNGMLLETSTNSGSVGGTFYLYYTSSFGPPRISIRGTSSAKTFDANPGVSALTKYVTSITTDLATASLNYRSNSTNINLTETGTTSPANFAASQPLYICRRAGTSLPFAGRLYSLIIRGAMTDASLINRTEQWIAAKTGVTL